MERHGHMAILRELLETQLLAVLGTHHEGEPYTSLVGFAASPDLKLLYFATGRATRKRANLAADARASMLIDNRRNHPADFSDAAAATAVGTVEEVEAPRGPSSSASSSPSTPSSRTSSPRRAAPPCGCGSPPTWW